MSNFSGSWGDGSIVGFETKPRYLVNANIRQRFNDPNRCFATGKGWVYDIHPTKDEEVLVAIQDLSKRLLTAKVVAIEWGDASSNIALPNSVQTVILVFNERITVLGTPSFAISTTGFDTNIVASFISAYKNKLTFEFTVPAVASGTLSIEEQDIIDGSLHDYDGNLEESARLIPADVCQNIYPSNGKVIDLNPIISARLIPTTDFYTGISTATLRLTYEENVHVSGSPTIQTSWQVLLELLQQQHM